MSADNRRSDSPIGLANDLMKTANYIYLKWRDIGRSAGPTGTVGPARVTPNRVEWSKSRAAAQEFGESNQRVAGCSYLFRLGRHYYEVAEILGAQ